MKGKGGAMKTVKEVSELTGISIRTLRYYDEIDLLKPAKVTEAGYLQILLERYAYSEIVGTFILI